MKRWTFEKPAGLLLLAATALVACGPAENGPGDPAEPGGAEESAAPEVRAMTEGLAIWRADGFTMLVPIDADIVPRSPEPPETWASILAGPGFYQEGEGGELEPGPPTYRVDAATYAKPDSIELEAWVASRLAERGEEAGANGVVVPVSGKPALRTGAGPREFGAVSYWLERDGKVVEFRLDEEPESPLGGIQRHVQSLILSTFRWSGETAGQ